MKKKWIFIGIAALALLALGAVLFFTVIKPWLHQREKTAEKLLLEFCLLYETSTTTSQIKYGRIFVQIRKWVCRRLQVNFLTFLLTNLSHGSINF